MTRSVGSAPEMVVLREGCPKGRTFCVRTVQKWVQKASEVVSVGRAARGRVSHVITRQHTSVHVCSAAVAFVLCACRNVNVTVDAKSPLKM